MAIGQALSDRRLSAHEVTGWYLARIEALNHAGPQLNAVRELASGALEAAKRADRELAAGHRRGPLHGIPVLLKDNVLAADMTATAGAAALKGFKPRRDATLVARLRAAGAIVIGKTNLTEFAYSGLGLNPHFGTPRNPHGSGRVPGGSSSGSAVAVASGVVPCAIGTDTSGSIRVPAAFCGIVGFKPTAARVERAGVFPLAPTLDSVGPLATSVADAIALDALLRGVETNPLPAAVPRLVVPDGELVDDAEPAVAGAFAAALEALAGAGAAVERRPLAALRAVPALFAEHGSHVMHEAWRVHRELLDGPDAERLDPRVLRRLLDGRVLPADGYEIVLRERARLQAQLAAELGDALAVWPAVGHAAPELAPLERDDELFARVNMGTLRNTMPASFLDMPGASLPIGEDPAGLPLGLLLSGPPGSDDRVLAAALAVAERVR